LGLAISKQLAEMMGGEVGLESQPGLGSEFWFTVRMGRQPEGVPVEALSFADLQSAPILVVDDNATNRDLLIAQCASWQVRAQEAADGATALQLLRRARTAGQPFRAALIDLQMPGMDGATLARAIKADAELKYTRLILMTPLGHREDPAKSAMLGFVTCLPKPVRQSELFNCLSDVLVDQVAPQTRPMLSTPIARATLNRFADRQARILLAEDNIVNQTVAVAILRTMGLKAEVVANGAEAIKALETIPYDLVLMDAQMPEMDGFEATLSIRGLNSRALNPRVPIIAMTANAMQGDREKCLGVGMDDYVSKPVSPQTLADALERWLPKKTSTNSNAPGGANRETAAVSAAPPEPRVFDQAGMLRRLSDDRELAGKLITCFLQDVPRQIEALRLHLESGNQVGARRHAHTLLGAAANVGGEALRDVALEMETAAAAGDLTAGKARFAELTAQFDRLQTAMTKS
jgi:CheY-like chemotaxis protein/HPt (histidine-containing phosphotransfer) domain-containing protein